MLYYLSNYNTGININTPIDKLLHPNSCDMNVVLHIDKDTSGL